MSTIISDEDRPHLLFRIVTFFSPLINKKKRVILFFLLLKLPDECILFTCLKASPDTDTVLPYLKAHHALPLFREPHINESIIIRLRLGGSMSVGFDG